MNQASMPAPVTDPGQKYYTVSFDEKTRTIRAVLRDFWTIDIMAAYLDALTSFTAASKRNFGQVHMLIDRREMPVQAPEVNALAEERFKGAGAPDRLAVVGDLGLRQMQMKRTASHHTMNFFTTVEEAEAWILGH